jgi:uncharacterized membrane protein (UPF0127 family)
MRYTLKKNNEDICDDIKIADGFVDRLIGLMFKKEMNGFNGLWIKPCNSIHTCFMKYDIDVLFLDKNNKVVKVFRSLRPWRMTRIYFTVSSVLEFKGGSLSSKIQEGDQLEVVCIS